MGWGCYCGSVMTKQETQQSMDRVKRDVVARLRAFQAKRIAELAEQIEECQRQQEECDQQLRELDSKSDGSCE